MILDGDVRLRTCDLTAKTRQKQGAVVHHRYITEPRVSVRILKAFKNGVRMSLGFIAVGGTFILP